MGAHLLDCRVLEVIDVSRRRFFEGYRGSVNVNWVTIVLAFCYVSSQNFCFGFFAKKVLLDWDKLGFPAVDFVHNLVKVSASAYICDKNLFLVFIFVGIIAIPVFVKK